MAKEEHIFDPMDKVWIWHGEIYDTLQSKDTKVVNVPLQNENDIYDK